jgi:hypothetical protein
LICSSCGKKFNRDVSHVNTKIKKGQKYFYCSKSCVGKDFGNGRKRGPNHGTEKLSTHD